jgi:hypothetical protein
MLVSGKDVVLAIVAHTKISSTYADAPSSTICMCWLAPSGFKLIFRTLRDFSTGALVITLLRQRAAFQTSGHTTRSSSALSGCNRKPG